MSAAARARLNAGIWYTFDAFTMNAAARWAAPALKLLHAEGNRAAAAYGRSGRSEDAQNAVDPEAWAAYIKRLALATVPEGWRMIEEAIQEVIRKAAAEDPATRAALQYLRDNGGQRTAAITKSSRDVIGNQIRIGMSKGESNQQIAERLTKHYKTVAPSRAATIARTEVHAAANYGSLAAATAAPVPVAKQWLSTPDGRTRDSHRLAQGQYRMIDQPFSVGGESLMYPGDSSLGAGTEETANCRCSMGYRKMADPPAKPRRAA